jgi:hypothetical protein
VKLAVIAVAAVVALIAVVLVNPKGKKYVILLSVRDYRHPNHL